MSDCNRLNSLLVTANVGSIFEDPKKTLKQWIAEFLRTIEELSPSFLALHCQEVGGKNYEESMQYVDDFVKELLSSDTLAKYGRVRIFLDEDFTAEDKFTALGNLYFIHDSVSDVHLWNFSESKFELVEQIEIVSGNIEEASIIEKHKFPKNYFPDCKWSRKGYIRTRWNIQDLKFDLFNIHLFHDASNLAALEKSPSSYCHFRKQAFHYVLEKVSNDKLDSLPMFVFGDFNFRLDSCQLVNKLTDKLVVHKKTNKKNGKLSQLQFKRSDEVILTVESKCFDHHKHEELFLAKNGTSMLEFDTETQAFQKYLYEFPISFPPSYPFSEDTNIGCKYMRTRCPSWCDRILLNYAAKDIIIEDESTTVDYKMMGKTVCMGDHKPIYLHVQLSSLVKATETEGNNNSIMILRPCDVVTHADLHRKISINGEVIPENNLSATSLLHKAKFRRESSVPPSLLARAKGFRDIAKYIQMVGSTLLRWKSVENQCSSEEESDENGNTETAGVITNELPGLY